MDIKNCVNILLAVRNQQSQTKCLDNIKILKNINQIKEDCCICLIHIDDDHVVDLSGNLISLENTLSPNYFNFYLISKESSDNNIVFVSSMNFWTKTNMNSMIHIEKELFYIKNPVFKNS